MPLHLEVKRWMNMWLTLSFGYGRGLSFIRNSTMQLTASRNLELEKQRLDKVKGHSPRGKMEPAPYQVSSRPASLGHT